jgi:hypothetical protein
MMGCSPSIDQSISEVTATTTTKPDPISKSMKKLETTRTKKKCTMVSSLDATTDTIHTDPSSDFDHTPELSPANHQHWNSIQKAQRVWGNVYDLETAKEEDEKTTTTTTTKLNSQQQQLPQNDTINHQEACDNIQQDQSPTLEQDETPKELTQDSKAFSTDEIYRDLELAFASMQRSKQEQQKDQWQQPIPLSRRVVASQQQALIAPALMQQRTHSLLTMDSSFYINSSSYLDDDNDNDDSVPSSVVCATKDEVVVSHPNPIVARMQRSLQNNTSSMLPSKRQQSSSSLASHDWNWTKCS